MEIIGKLEKRAVAVIGLRLRPSAPDPFPRAAG
jgi:hypothetical protein